MPKCNKGALIRTTLLLFFLVPLTLDSCRSPGKTGKADGKDTASVAPMDSLSLPVLDELIRKNPKSPDLFAKRAEFYAERENYTQALSDITIALRMDSLNPDYYISQAGWYLITGEPNSAKKGLNQCLKIFPDNTDVMHKMAEIHLALKEYGQAKMMLKDVLSINDDLAQTYFIQGLIALENSDTLGAIRNFQVTIDKEPDYYAAYVQAGKIYAGQSDGLAIQYLMSAIDLQPGMYEAHYLLGYFYQEHGFLEEAQQEYEYITSRIDSTEADPYYNMGYIEMVYKSNYEEAAKWFTKAIEREPAYANAWYNRGFSYELDGKLTQAKNDYQKAMEIVPNFPLAIKGLNRIEDGKPMKRK